MQEYLIYSKIKIGECDPPLVEIFSSDLEILRIESNLHFFGITKIGKLLDEFSGSKNLSDRQIHAKNISELLTFSEKQVVLVHSNMNFLLAQISNLKKPIIFSEGSPCNVSNLIDFLIDTGYIRSSEIFDCGEFSLRGQILDIATARDFFRITLNGNSVESIYTIDREDGMKKNKVSLIHIFPFQA